MYFIDVEIYIPTKKNDVYAIPNLTLLNYTHLNKTYFQYSNE